MNQLGNGQRRTAANRWAPFACRNVSLWATRLGLLIGLGCAVYAHAQQPAEPVDISPIDGETYYLVNQLSGLQIDLNSNATAAGASVVQNTRSFTSLSQRWALTKLSSGNWAISNLANGLCLDSSTSAGTTLTVQNPCAPTGTTQQWSLTAATNGYVTLLNQGTGLLLDVSSSSQTPGADLDQTAASATPAQSQQWLLRPVFFRGIDNALLEKQEAERVAGDVPWWQDAGQPQDVLQILKNHGVNMVRVRPTSEPPYNTYTSTACTGNGCYAETDPVDLDLAKRAKQLGMSVELTLLFDGGSSASIPGAWTNDTLTQAGSAVYNYVLSEVEAYRAAGVMPDMVTIGNEVDTGFLGSLASPTGNDFGPFAALEQQGMQAVLDASSDPSIGLPIPPPIRCIHITPAWDLTSFFGYVNSNSIPYDAMCQSYYPFDHGPLTAAQAAASNPGNQPVEETALTTAANAIGKPIFVIETAEHYENGFEANDPWYPATLAGQRQFLIDLEGALKDLPNHLGMGFEFWDPAGVDIPASGGGYTNGNGLTTATYTWTGLTLFDNAINTPNYSATLPSLPALGGKLDPTLAYKLVNLGNGQILETAGLPSSSGIMLNGGTDTGNPTLDQQWSITSNDDGYFQIANLNLASGEAEDVLDTGGYGNAGTSVSATPASSGTTSQEWDIVTTGGGTYAIVNKSSGFVLAGASSEIVQLAPTSARIDWVTPASQLEQWNIIPVHITGASVPMALSFAASNFTSVAYGSAIGTVLVDLEDHTGALVLSPDETITLTVTGPNGFSQNSIAVSSNGIASFDLSSLFPASAGNYTLTATSSGLVSATATLTVTQAILTVASQNATREYGASDPTFNYGITGFVNGDTQSVVTGVPILSTPATTASPPGNYDIAIQAGTLSATNYTFALMRGTLTVTTASTTTTLSASSSTVSPGQSVVLTATVASTTGAIVAGTVAFFSGTTALGTGLLNSSGVATYSVASLSAGVDAITASYAGNTDFGGSTSAVLSVAEPSFTLTGIPTSLTISPGDNSSAVLTFTPVGGYADTVAMSCTTPLVGVTCSFSPAAYTADGSNKVLTGSVTVSASSSATLTPLFKLGHDEFLAALWLLFPVGSGLLTGMRRKRLQGRTANQLFLLLLLAAGTTAMTACGGGGSSGTNNSGPQAINGTVTVTAAGSNVTRSLNLSVTIP